jgi:hypothetical protein
MLLFGIVSILVIACGKREAFAQESEATKQSILSLCREMDCFAAFAMTYYGWTDYG